MGNQEAKNSEQAWQKVDPKRVTTEQDLRDYMVQIGIQPAGVDGSNTYSVAAQSMHAMQKAFTDLSRQIEVMFGEDSGKKG